MDNNNSTMPPLEAIAQPFYAFPPSAPSILILSINQYLHICQTRPRQLPFRIGKQIADPRCFFTSCTLKYTQQLNPVAVSATFTDL